MAAAAVVAAIARRSRVAATAPPRARHVAAVTARMAVTGSSATSTNPVRKVPAREPSVPAADSDPTTAPDPSTRCSRARVTAGATIASAVTDGRVDTATSTTAAYGPDPRTGPTSRTSGPTASTPNPPTTSAPAATRRGDTTSAHRPPNAAPAAMPARATPMTAVVVSRVSPTYGATSRVARVSTTRIAAPLVITTTRARRAFTPPSCPLHTAFSATAVCGREGWSRDLIVQRAGGRAPPSVLEEISRRSGGSSLPGGRASTGDSSGDGSIMSADGLGHGRGPQRGLRPLRQPADGTPVRRPRPPAGSSAAVSRTSRMPLSRSPPVWPRHGPDPAGPSGRPGATGAAFAPRSTPRDALLRAGQVSRSRRVPHGAADVERMATAHA